MEPTITTSAVNYRLQNGVATITIDDGKRNALSPAVLKGIYRALDQAEQDKALVILTGRDEVFSAGFDLKVMKRGGSKAIGMLAAGYGLTARVLRYPYPLIAACNGHSLAMGVFLMLSADHIIGSRGDFKIAANEVAIGMPMPRVAALTLANRLTPAAYQRAVTLAAYFTVDTALDAGFFDEVVEPGDLLARAHERAEEYRALSMPAHTWSKRYIRSGLIRKIRINRILDLVHASWLGVKAVMGKSSIKTG